MKTHDQHTVSLISFGGVYDSVALIYSLSALVMITLMEMMASSF